MSLKSNGAVGIGITENNMCKLDNKNSFLFHGNVKKNDIIDMYLDLNCGQLTCITNNVISDFRYNINKTLTYRMCVMLKPNYSLELISFQHSKVYNVNNNILLNVIGYSQSLCNFEERIKYLDDMIKYYPNMNILHNDYINCLVILKHFDKAYEYIIKHSNVIQSNLIHNVLLIADYLYNKKQEYQNAFDMCELKVNENDIETKYIELIAGCYESQKEDIFIIIIII